MSDGHTERLRRKKKYAAKLLSRYIDTLPEGHRVRKKWDRIFEKKLRQLRKFRVLTFRSSITLLEHRISYANSQERTARFLGQKEQNHDNF